MNRMIKSKSESNLSNLDDELMEYGMSVESIYSDFKSQHFQTTTVKLFDIISKNTNDDIATIIHRQHEELIIAEKYRNCLNQLIMIYERDEMIFIRKSDIINKQINVINFKNRDTGLLLLYPQEEYVIECNNHVYGFNIEVAGLIIESDM